MNVTEDDAREKHQKGKLKNRQLTITFSKLQST